MGLVRRVVRRKAPGRGMVDTPEGDWYAFMFQDRGPLGRAPVVMPMTFDEEGFPVLGDHGRVPRTVSPVRTDGVPACAPLNGDDDFRYAPDADGIVRLAPFWQFSHNPDPEGWSVEKSASAHSVTTGPGAGTASYSVGRRPKSPSPSIVSLSAGRPIMTR